MAWRLDMSTFFNFQLKDTVLTRKMVPSVICSGWKWPVKEYSYLRTYHHLLFFLLFSSSFPYFFSYVCMFSGFTKLWNQCIFFPQVKNVQIAWTHLSRANLLLFARTGNLPFTFYATAHIYNLLHISRSTLRSEVGMRKEALECYHRGHWLHCMYQQSTLFFFNHDLIT